MTRIFISYSRNDGNDQSERLQGELEAHGFDIWRDIRNLDPAQDFTADIERGIDSADWVVVCITSDTLRKNSFVRREIQYALLCDKPVIPLRFEKDIKPQISIVNNEWVDFFAGWDEAFARLYTLFGGDMDAFRITAVSSDPFRRYVEYLYERCVEYFKHSIIGSKPIELFSDSTQDAVDAPLTPTMQHRRFDPFDQLFYATGIAPDIPEPNAAPQQFARFADAFEYYGKRVLLLGEPGAGKTVTLMTHTRNAAAARLDDPNAPLPLFQIIAFWDTEQQPPLEHWFAQSYGDLLPFDAVKQEIEAGQVLFLLDGLDELGGERENPETKERYDPRKRFMDALGTHCYTSTQNTGENGALITCRVKDYAVIGQKIALNGAVTLHPLSDNQMRDYLRTMPELWTALEADDDLREVARTPLLLSLFADGYKENAADAEQLRDLRTSPGELRDKIFEIYVHKRYMREQRRMEQIGASLPFTLDETYTVLGRVAMWDANSYQENVLPHSDFTKVIPDETALAMFIDSMIRLHLIAARIVEWNATTYRFIHLLLRDHFAFEYAWDRIHHQDATERDYAIDALGGIGDPRAIGPLMTALQNDDECCDTAAESLKRIGAAAVEPLITALGDQKWYVRSNVAQALGAIGDTRAVYPLTLALDSDDHPRVRRSVAEALGLLGDTRALESLITALQDDSPYVRSTAALALGTIGDSQAIDPLLGTLLDIDRKVRSSAMFALGKIGEPAVKPLLNSLGSTDGIIRYRAATVLGRIGSTNAVAPLITALNDSDNEVRSSAADALGRIGDSRAVAPLIESFSDTTMAIWWGRRVCDTAATALTRIGTPEALAAVDAWRASQDTPPASDLG